MLLGANINEVIVKHKLKGEKMIIKTKKWGETKKGYGWIYSSRGRYFCNTKSENPQITSPDIKWSESQLPVSANETESLGIESITGKDSNF